MTLDKEEDIPGKGGTKGNPAVSSTKTKHIMPGLSRRKWVGTNAAFEALQQTSAPTQSSRVSPVGVPIETRVLLSPGFAGP